MNSSTGTMLYTEAKDEIPKWHFSDPTTNKRGGKSVFIFRGASNLVSPTIQLTRDTDPRLKTPFGITKFDEASSSTRLNLDFNLECKELEQFFQDLDAHLPKVAHEKCMDWFKKSLSVADINLMYKPMVTTHEKYTSMVRTKVNTAGPHAVRVWKVTGYRDGKCNFVEGGVDDIVKGATFWANVSVTGMYFLARLFGCTLTTTDVLVFPPAKQSIPFLTQITLEPEGNNMEDDDMEDEGDGAPFETASGSLATT